MTKQILTISADTKILGAFEISLAEADYSVIVVSHPNAALRFFEEKSIDLIFLDVNTSLSELIDLIEQFRNKRSDVPLCLIASDVEKLKMDIGDQKEALLKNTTFMNKPLVINTLKQAISDQFDG